MLSVKGAAALALAARGYAVFPCYSMRGGGCSCGNECKSPGKHPKTSNGHKAATTDQDKTQRRWQADPEANIGLATGSVSGVWVLDLDGPEGIEALAQLETQHGSLPVTVSARTGGGGRHISFRLPDDVEIKSRAKIGGLSIDTRGEGGYVIVPPSNHRSGNPYEWENSPENTPLADAPQWLLDFVTSKSIKVRTDSSDDFFEQVTGDPDLRTAPGAPKYSRHSKACELIGSYIARGEHLAELGQYALAWGKRCTPPLEQDEILRIVSDLARKEEEKLEDACGIGEEVPWPTLSEVALYGLAGDIVRAIAPHSESDPAALLVQVLLYFGNVIGYNAYFLVEGTRHRAKLFTVLVGETAKGRKGTSEGRVRALFVGVDPEWVMTRIVTGLSSGEGLIWAVRDPIEKEEPVKGKGVLKSYQKVIVDQGVADKRLLVVEPEFAAVLRITKRDGNTLSPTIRSAWDDGPLQLMTKNSPGRAARHHVSILGHVTLEELQTSLPEVDGFNGYANRHLWVCVRRSQLLPEGGGAVDLAPLVGRLKDAVDFAKEAGELRRDEEATKAWAEFYKAKAKGHGGLFGAATSRAEAQVLRLSSIYALLDGSTTVRAEHLKAAIAVWQYAEDSARYIFGSSTGDALADKLLAILKEGPAAKKELYGKTGGHAKAKDVDRALGKLKKLKLATVERVKTAGRPAERWSAL
ncbi:MAG: bifunctional DNA primase/polymerase [Gemmataceae bacterium]